MNSQKRRSAEVSAWIAFGLTSLCAVFMLGMVAWTRAGFARILSQLDVELPQPTRVALGWAFLAIPVAVIIVALIKELTIPNKVVTLLISSIIQTILIFALAFYFFSLLLPFMIMAMTPRTG